MNEPQLSAEQKKEWVVKKIYSLMKISQQVMAVHVLSNFLNTELATARAEGAKGERVMITEEIKQVCKVHNYLDDKTRDKVIRFIKNLGVPQPEIALTTKEHHAE